MGEVIYGLSRSPSESRRGSFDTPAHYSTFPPVGLVREQRDNVLVGDTSDDNSHRGDGGLP